MTKLMAPLLASGMALAAVQASAATLYVASNGGIGANCSVSTPCDTLGGALSRANSGDTIVCLSAPATNSGVTITKSVTIDCGAPRALVADVGSSTGGVIWGISINVPSTDPNGAIVRLRGLTVEGGGSNGPFYDRGIDIVAANAVHIEDCVVSNVGQIGIYDRRTGGQTRLYVRNTVVSGNKGPGMVAASQGTAITVLDNVGLLNNTYGFAAARGNNVAITRSTVSGNTVAGLEADPGAQLNVSNSVVSHNATNVQAYGTIRLRDNDIEFSNTAIQGDAISFGANRFSGNGSVGTAPSLVSGAPADLYN